MRFAFYSVALLSAMSQAVSLPEEPVAYDLENQLAQTEAEAENGNLVEALSKVISSLSTNPPAAAAGEAGAAKDGEKKEEKAPAKKPGADQGTNIAITTATDQHINIFVPEDGGPVKVKKTDGVKIVESDSDRADKNKDVKKAISDKIKGQLVKKAVRDTTTEDDEVSSDVDKKLKNVSKQISNSKRKTQEMKEHLEKESKRTHKHAQVAAQEMTEAEIEALQFAQVESDSEAESNSDSDADSSDGFAELDFDEDGYAEIAQDPLYEENVLAQVGAPSPAVKMTPQVHVQVTRVGGDK